MKIRFLLTRWDDVDDAALGDGLRHEAQRLDHAMPGRLAHRRAVQLADDRLRESAKGSFYTGAAPFDAMMEVVFNDPADLSPITAVLDSFSDRLANLVRPERSAVMVGAVNDILAGEGPVHIAIVGRRLPHLSHEDYLSYWFGNHSNTARSADTVVSGLFYRQFHADLEASEAVARATGLALHDFDGMSETYFADGATLERLYNAPGVWETALADERRFVDHDRSVLSLFLMSDP